MPKGCFHRIHEVGLGSKDVRPWWRIWLEDELIEEVATILDKYDIPSEIKVDL